MEKPWFANIVVGVDDLDNATERFRRLGFEVLDGGAHADLGTANRIVPLGGSYLELLAVVDRQVADRTPFGRSLSAYTDTCEGLVRWSLRTRRLDEVAAGLGLAPEARSRTLPDGRVLRWRAAGIELSLRESWLPFFVEWPDDDFPGDLPAGHAIGVEGVAWLALAAGDRDRLARWTNEARLPVRHEGGPAGLVACGIALDFGELVVRTGSNNRLALELHRGPSVSP